MVTTINCRICCRDDAVLVLDLNSEEDFLIHRLEKVRLERRHRHEEAVHQKHETERTCKPKRFWHDPDVGSGGSGTTV